MNLNGYLPTKTVNRYKTIEYSDNADIKYEMHVNSGSMDLYGIVCEKPSECIIKGENIKNFIQEDKLIKSIKSPSGYSLTIPDELNKCHRLREKEDSLKNEAASMSCGVYSVAYCKGEKPCSYNIQSTHKSVVNQLVERKPHYQLISFNDTDIYKIKVSDKDTKNITIVLNSHSGDADLYVSSLNNNYDSRSLNEGYLPDVLTIEKSTYLPDISGEYMIYVKGETFASYSIYFYTQKLEKEDEKYRPSIVMLHAGKIIKGYIKEEVGKINYKVYSFNPKILVESNPLDLRISLTPEHSEYQMYVTYDYEKISFENLGEEVKLKDYDFKAKDNEIVINKNDTNYRTDSYYYVVVIPKHDYNSNNNSSITNSDDTLIDSFNSLFYIGFTTEDIPFIIKEGIPSSITLDENYKQQNYWFYHYNISQPIDISLNVYYGKVDIYVDLWWSENIANSTTAIKALNTDSNFITISPEKIINLLGNDNNKYENAITNNYEENLSKSIIPFYILINKSGLSDASYLLSIKSESSIPEKLHPDIVRSDSLLSGETKKYFFHVRKYDNGILSINFKSGYGDLLMNIYESNVKDSLENYPSKKIYQIRGEDHLRGKLIDLNDKILSRCAGSCKILISVIGNNLDITEEKIEYSLSFYKKSLKLNQNKPFHGQVNQGEMKFFQINFGKEDKNVYISLTNMNGDADIYVNYGLTLPTYENSDWSSSTSHNEFIEFNKEDNYFSLNNLDDISGKYTIMISGFEKSTFTLYVSSHPNKIISLNNDSPASCITKEKNEYCYFRYDDVYDYDHLVTEALNNGDQNKKNLDIVINTHFYYGTGAIFAKLNDNNDYDILDDFPNVNNFDYSNIYGNERNFLYLEISKDDKKFNSNSTLLIAVQCEEKCFLDLITSKQYDSTIKFLSEKKDNFFYLHKDSDNLFIYKVQKENADILLNIKVLRGDGNVTVYTKDKFTSDAIDHFRINSETTELNDVNKRIDSYRLRGFLSVYFKIKAYSNLAFIFRLTYPHEWEDINVGQSQTYIIDHKKMQFYGSINFDENYDHLSLSISTNNKLIAAYCYLKYMVLDKNEILKNENPVAAFNKLRTQLIPNENDNDFKADNTNMYHLIMLKLPKLNKDNLKNKIIKALFSVTLFDHSREKDIKDIKIKINVSPQTNYITVGKIERNSFQYVNVEGFGFDGSIHIYELNRNMLRENILILETSSCRGNVDILVSPKVIQTKQDAKKFAFFALSPSSIDYTNGKIVYVFKNVNSDNLYLMIKGKKFNDETCDFDNNIFKSDDKKFCENTEVLIKYLFTSDVELRGQEAVYNPGVSINYEIQGNDSVLLKWKPLKNAAENDDFYNSKKLENMNSNKIQYKIYVTNSKKDFNYMDSVCYLNTMSKEKLISVEIQKNDDLYTATVGNFEKGKPYYINIFAKDLETDEIYAYKSLEIVANGNQIPPLYLGII